MDLHKINSSCKNATLADSSHGAFTLIEILVVLGVISLGWLWVPSVFKGNAAGEEIRFASVLEQTAARARMEAITRQTPVALAINPEGTRLALGYTKNGDFTIIQSMEIPTGVVFYKSASSVAGNPNVFTIVNNNDGFWLVWWFDKLGRRVDIDGNLQANGTLVFTIEGIEAKWQLEEEGALVRIRE